MGTSASLKCVCPREGVDVECPVHGLPEGQKFEPMDRHAKPGEDARLAQLRLYAEAMGKPVVRECVRCKRKGTRGFVPARDRPYGFQCAATKACRVRQGLPAVHGHERLWRRT